MAKGPRFPRKADGISTDDPAAAVAAVEAPPGPANAAVSDATTPVGGRARIRMYRQGLGDCFLITLYGGEKPFQMLIDCGVILGTPGAATKMGSVVADIATTTDAKLDLLVGTHEHWDHLSGFVQAQDAFDRIKAAQVWLGWTENPDDPVARQLVAGRQAAVAALTVAEAHLRLDGGGNALQAAQETRSILDFFGAAGGTTTDALDYLRKRNPTYRHPQDAPLEVAPGVRIYSLGPPTDLALLKKSTPSQGQSYGLDAVDQFLDNFGADLKPRDQPPFDASQTIPLEVAVHQPFFRQYYLDPAEARRRIDTAWVEPASDVALKLDSDTNNTSVALAIELSEGGDVLLFAADAQIGNWLSWADLKWQVGGRTVTGPDLLRRTIVYKVGHHGSHNATLKPGGLEIMDALRYALIPVDQAMAQAKHWGRMPLDEIVAELDHRTGGRFVRLDQPASPAAVQAGFKENLLYFDLIV